MWPDPSLLLFTSYQLPLSPQTCQTRHLLRVFAFAVFLAWNVLLLAFFMAFSIIPSVSAQLSRLQGHCL